MKLFFKKLMANIRPILQIIGLLILLFFPRLLDVSNIAVKQLELTTSQNWKDYIFYYVCTKGDIAIGIFISVLALFGIRKANKDYMFNKGNVYKNYPYFWYWICAKILGYAECSLILVPIHMQFKLVLRDTFNRYYCGNLSKKENDIISINKSNFSNILDEINLIISDTYPLKESQIPITKRGYPTILISRDNVIDHNRYNSPELVQKVVNEVRNLPDNIKKVNVYAATNPENTINIVKDAFKLGERSNLDIVTVFQQKRTGQREFKRRGKVVYKRN